eukprot:7812880-Karenia_brevis.AAC.1
MVDSRFEIVSSLACNILDLNSDHRVVMTTVRNFDLWAHQNRQNESRISKACTLNFKESEIEERYQDSMLQKFSSHPPKSLRDIEDTIITCTKQCKAKQNSSNRRPWETMEIEELKQLRRMSQSMQERRKFSLQLKK